MAVNSLIWSSGFRAPAAKLSYGRNLIGYHSDSSEQLSQTALTAQNRGIMHQYVIFVTVQEKHVESTSLKLSLCDGLLQYWYIHGPQRNEPPLTFPVYCYYDVVSEMSKILDKLTWGLLHSWSPEDDPCSLWDLRSLYCCYDDDMCIRVGCPENFWMNCHEILFQRFMFSWGYTGRASVTPLQSTICNISALKWNLLSCLPTSNQEKSIILFKVTVSFTWSPPMIPHCFNTFSN